MIRSVVTGCGAYLPERIMTNAEIAQKMDTSDEWIRQRTGIRQRHIAARGELTSDLATAAAREALERAGLSAADLDMIVLATTTPDNTFPASAVTVQANLGMEKGAAFDIQAVCSGFIYALNVADNFIRTGQCTSILVIGAEIFSRLLDWNDRATCVLFGDGAGAVVLQAQEGSDGQEERGLLSIHLHSDGRYRDMLYVDGGPASTGTVGHVRMVGREVFRHAVVNISAAIEEALQANGFGTGDIDWFIPHQANRRILDTTARRMGLSPEKVIMTVDVHANTSAASIPLALNTLFTSGRLEPGHLCLLEAMGGGFTWGSALLRW